MKQGAVAQTALVKLALASLFNDVLRKQLPRKLALLTRKPGPAGNDGLPSAIECGNQGANGVRSKYAGIYMIVEELAHASLQEGCGYITSFGLVVSGKKLGLEHVLKASGPHVHSDGTELLMKIALPPATRK